MQRLDGAEGQRSMLEIVGQMHEAEAIAARQPSQDLRFRAAVERREAERLTARTLDALLARLDALDLLHVKHPHR